MLGERIDEMLDFHFNALQGIYFSEIIQNKNYTILYSDLIEDSYYNYAAKLSDGIEKYLTEIESFFVQKKRMPALYLSPNYYLYGKEGLIPKKYQLWSTDAWMVYKDPSFYSNFQPPNNIHILNVNTKESNSLYVETFEKAFSSEDPNDVYGQLPPYYGQSLERAIGIDTSSFKNIFVIAYINKEAAGVASVIFNEKFAGLYGIGTIQSERNKGIGTILIKYLIDLVNKDNKRIVFLQTEKGGYSEKWAITRGFETIFNAYYYVKYQT